MNRASSSLNLRSIFGADFVPLYELKLPLNWLASSSLSLKESLRYCAPAPMSRHGLLGKEKESSEPKSGESKSDEYSSTMTHAMGAVLTYRHELGMNYNFVLPDLIVGSCLQTPSDVDRLKEVGVKTVFCLQQDPDIEYFGVDICAIQERAKEIGGIEHIRAQIRDFDPFDLRQRLPAVVAILNRAVQRNKGITYIHCTAGLGRAPAVALAYMYWLLGYELLKANEMLLSVRPCFPKLEAIRNATCDLGLQLTGGTREMILFKWPDDDCEKVEISGLDVGWGQVG
ncbi:hypothetical protein L7F22_038637 [Adiantum nelumboides]|nr:hypothetical protein [Adiantum nelumboides]